ncbi:MAG TPA: hypothetical protein DIT04_06120 [Dysgonomonas sp.]|nr:hypothetical protein [Dysgonomonas sp.]
MNKEGIDIPVFERKDGENIRMLIPLCKTTQREVADKLNMHESTFSLLFNDKEIDDDKLDEIAAALGHGMTKECIKYYNHKSVLDHIVNYNWMTVEEGGKGVFTEYNTHNTTTTSTSNTSNELDFIKEYGKTKERLMYFRMLVEPEKVKAEIDKEKEEEEQ